MLKAVERFVLILLLAVVFVACGSKTGQKSSVQSNTKESSGPQILIGNRPISKELVSQMIEKSGIRKGGYVVIIPTTYQANSKSVKLLRKAFYEEEIMAVHIINPLAESKKATTPLSLKNSDVLAIENARIICILDGNQHQFMNFATKTQLKQSLLNARENGALIAGFEKSASLFGDFRIIVKADTSSQQSKMFLGKGLSLINNAVVGDIQLLNQQQKAIRNKIQSKKITFIGLSKNSAVWISGKQATVLRKPKVAFIPHNSKGSRLSQGESYKLSQKAVRK